MKYYVCPKCMETFRTIRNKKMVHCNIKCFKVDKAEYKRVNEHRNKS